MATSSYNAPQLPQQPSAQMQMPQYSGYSAYGGPASYGGGGGGGSGGGGYGGFVTPQSQWKPQMQNKYAWQGGDPARQAQIGQIDWSGAGAQSAQQKAAMIQNYMKTGQIGGGGSGGGGYGGGAGGGGAGGGGFGLNENIGAVSQAGQGLLDPGSDYYKQLSQSMQRQIGQQSAAQERSAALRGAYGGLGGGASPELLATQADIGQAGLEAQGAAESGLALQAPQMGAGMLSSTFSPLLGIEQLSEQSKQFGAGLGEQARQFGVNTAMQQQSLAGEQAWRQAQLQQQQQLAQQEALMRQMAMTYGMF